MNRLYTIGVDQIGKIQTNRIGNEQLFQLFLSKQACIGISRGQILYFLERSKGIFPLVGIHLVQNDVLDLSMNHVPLSIQFFQPGCLFRTNSQFFPVQFCQFEPNQVRELGLVEHLEAVVDQPVIDDILIDHFLDLDHFLGPVRGDHPFPLFRLCFGLFGNIVHKIVLIAVAADRTGVLGITLCFSSGLHHLRLIIVTQCIGLVTVLSRAAGAGIGSIALLGAGGRHRLTGDKIVDMGGLRGSQGIHKIVLVAVTAGSAGVLGVALGFGSGLHHLRLIIVTQRIGLVTVLSRAAGAGVGDIALLGAGGRHRLTGNEAVLAGSGHFVTHIAVTAGAGIYGIACRAAGGRYRLPCHIHMDMFFLMVMVVIMEIFAGFCGKGLHREHGKHHDHCQQERECSLTKV